MSIKISFGTDGWRGIIAEDFIFDNLRLVTRAVAEYVIDEGLQQRGIVVGYDNRFLSDRFAAAVAEEMNNNGIPVFMICKPTPTPVTAYAIKVHNAAGAVMLTASHNPPEYNGFKFIPEHAGPALPHVTKKIEENIKKHHGVFIKNLVEEAEGRYGHLIKAQPPIECPCDQIDPIAVYMEHINELVDFATIGKAGLKVIVDPMYGAGIGYLDKLLNNAGVSVETMHNHRDPLFGGGMPEPTGSSLTELKERLKQTGADLGLALDGDADRFGIIDSNGEYITPNQFLPLLYYHLMEVKGVRGPAARTVATTHLLDRIAAHYDQQVEETPVGFKFIGQCIHERGAIMGGEESGGLSIKGHIPEKDGILAGLLAVEMVAYHGKSLTELLEQVYQQFGQLHSRRLDVHTTPEQKSNVLSALAQFKPTEVAGQTVTDMVRVDGVKVILADGSWALIRASGTEPLFRIYAEAATFAQVEQIQADIRQKLAI